MDGRQLCRVLKDDRSTRRMRKALVHWLVLLPWGLSGGAVAGAATTSPAAANGRIFCAGADAAGRKEVFSLGPDGGDLKIIDAPADYVGWSRDGSKAWYSSAEDHQLWTMDPDGAKKRRVTRLGFGAGTPAPSPDGKRVAFTAFEPGGGHPEVWIMDADGANPRRLTVTTAGGTSRGGQRVLWSVHPSWSPDGRKILYASTSDGSTQAWSMDPDGRNKTRVSSGFGPGYPDVNVPEYSRDGKRVAIWSGYEMEYGEIWTMDPEGGDPRRITETADPMNSDNPTWSPDGKWLIFISNRPGGAASKVPSRGAGGHLLDAAGAGEINAWIVSQDGGAPRLLASRATYCAWQPLPQTAGTAAARSHGD